MKAYVGRHPELKGVFVGYPGNEAVCIGARGLYRAKLSLYGTAFHSGAVRVSKTNAITKAALLVERLSSIRFDEIEANSFGLPPKLSITEIMGGQGYSIIPDKCEVKVDLRLTPTFGPSKAAAIISDAVAIVDREYPTHRHTEVLTELSWPPYKLSQDNRLVTELVRAANEHFPREIARRVCGPSNVGNYLSGLGVDTVCGFGPTYKNTHAPNECVEISSIRPVHDTYLDTVRQLATR
jgi:succinyl-diaminopimelate desuccinylase